MLIRLPVQRQPEPDHLHDLEQLLAGASLLLREGNRIAALALLWAAIAIDPADLTAHRRLAAVLANSGDLQGALDEHARYRELLRAYEDFRALRKEMAYGAATLGALMRPRLLGGDPHDPVARLRRYLTPAI